MTTLPPTAEERVALSAAARGSGEGGAPSAGEIFAMLQRRMVLILVLFVLLSLVAVVGFWAWWTYLPGYEAECLIECISDIPEAQLTLEQQPRPWRW
jgi:hypothetical protein